MISLVEFMVNLAIKTTTMDSYKISNTEIGVVSFNKQPHEITHYLS